MEPVKNGNARQNYQRIVALCDSYSDNKNGIPAPSQRKRNND